MQDQSLPDPTAAALHEREPEEIVNDSQTFRRAVADLKQGLHQRELWLSLGWQHVNDEGWSSTPSRT